MSNILKEAIFEFSQEILNIRVWYALQDGMHRPTIKQELQMAVSKWCSDNIHYRNHDETLASEIIKWNNVSAVQVNKTGAGYHGEGVVYYKDWP